MERSLLGKGEESLNKWSCPGYITRMAAMPTRMLKTLKKISHRTKSPMILKLGIEHYMYVLKLFKAYINDDHELALTFFMIMSSWQN